MAKRKRKRVPKQMSWDSAFEAVESVISERRGRILNALVQSRDLREAFRQLRTGMRFHRWKDSRKLTEIAPTVESLDGKTRQEGVHVLHAWHHDRHEFLPEIMPVLLLDHALASGIARGFEETALSILFEYYLLHLLSLLALRAWDEGDPDANLDRVSRLLKDLQDSGSGFRFADDAESLLLLAISQYHPDEPAYDHLLGRIRRLNFSHRMRIARVMGAMLGGHLRWGFRDLYREDYPRLRRDNIVDYPWLVFSVLTLLQDLDMSRDSGDEAITDVSLPALLNALSADPDFLFGDPQTAFYDSGGEHLEVAKLLTKHRDFLKQSFTAQRPDEGLYSPLSFRFNFPHNVLVALLLTSLEQGVTWESNLNQLLMGGGESRPGWVGEGAGDSTLLLARALSGFSRRPERLDTRGAPQILYDPADGARSFDAVMAHL